MPRVDARPACERCSSSSRRRRPVRGAPFIAPPQACERCSSSSRPSHCGQCGFCTLYRSMFSRSRVRSVSGVWGSRLRGFQCKNLAAGQHHTAPVRRLFSDIRRFRSPPAPVRASDPGRMEKGRLMAGGGPGGGRPLGPPLEAGRRGSAIYRKPCFPACSVAQSRYSLH